jgi:4'-phosphopantetheinyl transferase
MQSPPDAHVIVVTETAVGTVNRVSIAPDEAHVWLVSLDRSAPDVEHLYELLSAEERERAGSLPLRPRKRRYAVRQGALREVLSRYVEVAPEAVDLIRSERGKPALRHGPQFSVSDSGELALVAIASCAVGADLERVVDRRITRRVGCDAGRLEDFYERWTAREACAKALDRGLWSGWPEIELDCRRIDAGPGFVATLATRERVRRVRTHRYQI